MKRRNVLKYIRMIFFILLLAAQYSSGLAQSCLVRMQPNPMTVEVGETAQLVVEIVDVQDLYGVDLLIDFDPHVLEVVDAYPDQEGIQVSLGTFLDPGLEIRNLADNTTGTVRFAMTELNPSEPKSGSGVLVVITFKGKNISSSSLLTFQKVQLARRDGVEIQTDIENGIAQMVWNASEATNTLVPTQLGGTSISVLIQTVTAMPSKTSTQEASDTPAPTNTKKAQKTYTSTPIPTQVSSVSGGANPAITHTQSVSAFTTDESGSIVSKQASTEVSASTTEVQPTKKADTSASLPLEPIAIENIKNHSPSKPTKDSDKNSGLSLLFTGLGIGFMAGAVGFGLVYFLRKK